MCGAGSLVFLPATRHEKVRVSGLIKMMFRDHSRFGSSNKSFCPNLKRCMCSGRAVSCARNPGHIVSCLYCWSARLFPFDFVAAFKYVALIGAAAGVAGGTAEPVRSGGIGAPCAIFPANLPSYSCQVRSTSMLCPPLAPLPYASPAVSITAIAR